MDIATALEAAENWRTLARLTPTIEDYLEPRRGTHTGRTVPQSRPPIDITASDLLLELDEASTHYLSALMMETPDVRAFPTTLAERLTLIGDRHGHWTADPNQQVALAYCDEAHTLMGRARHLIEQPPPPKFMGPCLTVCGGDLWLKPGRISATCDTCGSEADLGAVRSQLMRALEKRLMKRAELVAAIRILGGKVTTEAVKKWVQRGRLVPAVRDPEMFRFTDVLALTNIEVAA